jgi:hypothetical protein
MVVECKNSQCQIVTQTFALKVKYQEDKSHDFKIIGNQIIIDVFECSECGEYGEKYRELTRYAHTTYIKYDPPHLWNGNVLSTPMQKQYIKTSILKICFHSK